MTSENDDLMPTGMNENTNQITNEFNDNSHKTHETEERKTQNTANVEVQDTVHMPHAYPEFRPGWDTSSADREIFNASQQISIQQHSQQGQSPPDAFDQIDAQRMTLNQRINQRSEASKEQIQDSDGEKTRDAFDQVDANAGLSQNFNTHAQGLDRD